MSAGRNTTVIVRYKKHLLASTVPKPSYPRLGGYNTHHYMSSAYSPRP